MEKYIVETAQPQPSDAKAPDVATQAAMQPLNTGKAVVHAPTEKELIDMLNDHPNWHATPDRPLPGEPGYEKK